MWSLFCPLLPVCCAGYPTDHEPKLILIQQVVKGQKSPRKQAPALHDWDPTGVHSSAPKSGIMSQSENEGHADRCVQQFSQAIWALFA